MTFSVRAWLLAAAVLALWRLCAALAEPHRIVDSDAPASSFSAVRAQRELATLLAPAHPHPVGSDADAAVQARIVARWNALGIPVHIYHAFVCNDWRGFAYIPCGSVTNIVAEILPGAGSAVLMMAHVDSVAAGPGAADDGSGVACLLESARALRASGVPSGAPTGHPVLALISDGEEAGLLGAAAFLQNSALASRVGAVVNVEARGTRGASLLFQTSPGDARLLQLYASHVKASAASSLFSLIYSRLPNDTDLTLFIRRGIPSVNFAIAENVQAYHSPLDRLSMLSAASLQMQGDNLLAMAHALQFSSFVHLGGADALYVSVLGRFLPRMPTSAALPLASMTFVLLLWAVRRCHRNRAAVELGLRALWATPLLVSVSVLGGFVLAWIAQVISRIPDPTYAHPLPMRIALGLALWFVLLLTSRLAAPRPMTAAVWLWFAALGLLAAWQSPAISPYLIWPAAFAAVLLWATTYTPGDWQGPWGRLAQILAALSALILWLPLASSTEALMGLKLHAAFSLCAAIGLSTLLPLLGELRPSTAERRTLLATSAGAAVLAAMVAGIVPSYSPTAPERLNLLYFGSSAGARWIADTTWHQETAGPLPLALLRAAPFVAQPLALPGLLRRQAYVAPAAEPPLSPPEGQIAPGPTRSATRQTRRTRQITLHLRGSAQTDEMALYIPAAAHLRGIDIRGQHLEAPAGWSGDTTLLCVTPDCRDELLTLQLGIVPGDVTLAFVEHRFGLPDAGRFLAAARPATAMPSQEGDETLLAGQVLLHP